MLYSKFLLVTLSLILLLGSCRPFFPATNAQRKEKRSWEAIVNDPATDNAVKSYWVDLIDDRWDYFKQHQNTLTKEDIPNVRFLHSLVYELDSASFFAFDGQRPIGPQLRLNTSDVVLYVLKKDSIEAIIYPKRERDIWENGGGYGVPFHGVANRIRTIHRLGGETYNIGVMAFPVSRQPYVNTWLLLLIKSS